MSALDDLKDQLDEMSPEEAASYLVKNWDSLPVGGKEQIDKVLARMDDTAVTAWMSENWDSIPANVAGYLSASASLSGNSEVEDLARRIRDGTFLDWVAETRAAEAVAGKQVSTDLDNDGTTEPAEQTAYDTAVDEATTKVAEENEKTTGVPAAETKDEITDLVDGVGLIPDSVLRFVGRRAPTPTEERKLIETYNEFNPDAPVSNIKDLYQLLMVRHGDPFVDSIVESAFLGTDPIVSYSVPLGDGRTVTVDQRQFDAFTAAYGRDASGKVGFSAKDLTTLVRTADKVGLVSATGESGWQILAALTRAQGMANLQVEMPEAKKVGPSGQLVNFWEMFAAGQKKDWVQNGLLQPLGLKFKEGQQLYGNDVLAYVHSLDSSLAAKIANTRPEKRTPQDLQKMGQYLIDGGFDEQALAQMGYYAIGLESFDTDARWAEPEASTPKRYLPDPVRIEQSSKDFYRSLFLDDPTPEQLQSFVRAVNKAVLGAASTDRQEVSIDPDAQIRAVAEGLPEYKALYGKKPAGMSEQEYQGQFRTGAGTILGNEAPDPEILRSGMRTGDYQTTVGAAAGSKQALNNSTWMGRLAQAAEIVAGST